MIQEIVATCTEVIDIHRPSLVWHGHAELILRVPLSAQRDKLLRDRGITWGIHNCEQRAADCDERRRLVELAIKSSEDPVQARDSKCNSGSRAGRIFCEDRGREMRLSNAAAQRQPRSDCELVFHEDCFHLSADKLPI